MIFVINKVTIQVTQFNSTLKCIVLSLNWYYLIANQSNQLLIVITINFNFDQQQNGEFKGKFNVKYAI